MWNESQAKAAQYGNVNINVRKDQFVLINIVKKIASSDFMEKLQWMDYINTYK